MLYSIGVDDDVCDTCVVCVRTVRARAYAPPTRVRALCVAYVTCTSFRARRAQPSAIRSLRGSLRTNSTQRNPCNALRAAQGGPEP